jgi:cysteine desulfurase
MALDIARIRGLFLALGDGWVHLDAPTGMQIPEQVTAAVITALRAPVSGPGGLFPASQRADAILDAARRSLADLVGADPAGVVLGPSVPVLLQRLADALGQSWLVGDEVVVSRLDHPANIAPWHQAAGRRGAITRWAEVDIETCELPAWQYDSLVNNRTKVVAITAASESVGTQPDLRRVAEAANKVGALMVVDASAAAPFIPLDMNTLPADIVAVSANGWGGPPVAGLVFRDANLVRRLPSSSLDPDAKGPERLELGPHQYPLLAGLIASIDYLAELDDAAVGPRRERLLHSMTSMQAHQTALLDRLIDRLHIVGGVHVIGDAVRRVPTLAFAVDRRPAVDVVAHLGQHGVCAFADSGHNGLFAALGVGEIGGVVRVGLAHYTNVADVDQLVTALSAL